MRFLFYLFILSQFLNIIDVFAEKVKKRTAELNPIKWEKVHENKPNKLKKIIWKSYNGDEIYFENEDIEFSSDKKIIKIKDKNKSYSEKKIILILQKLIHIFLLIIILGERNLTQKFN